VKTGTSFENQKVGVYGEVPIMEFTTKAEVIFWVMIFLATAFTSLLIYVIFFI